MRTWYKEDLPRSTCKETLVRVFSSFFWLRGIYFIPPVFMILLRLFLSPPGVPVRLGSMSMSSLFIPGTVTTGDLAKLGG